MLRWPPHRDLATVGAAQVAVRAFGRRRAVLGDPSRRAAGRARHGGTLGVRELGGTSRQTCRPQPTDAGGWRTGPGPREAGLGCAVRDNSILRFWKHELVFGRGRHAAPPGFRFRWRFRSHSVCFRASGPCFRSMLPVHASRRALGCCSAPVLR